MLKKTTKECIVYPFFVNIALKYSSDVENILISINLKILIISMHNEIPNSEILKKIL